jgi:hypothetical protein
MVFEWGSLAICLVMYLVCSLYHPVRFDICRIKLIAGIQRESKMAYDKYGAIPKIVSIQTIAIAKSLKTISLITIGKSC